MNWKGSRLDKYYRDEEKELEVRKCLVCEGFKEIEDFEGEDGDVKRAEKF